MDQKKKGIYITIVIELAVALLGSAIYLFQYFMSSKENADLNEQLREDLISTVPATTAEATTEAPTEEETTEPTTEPQATYAEGRDYKAFYEKNPNEDFVGWLRIDGTKIDYPVMQSSVDNANYYLYRDYNKKNSTPGTIYAREQCDIFKPSDNITLYGHTYGITIRYIYLKPIMACCFIDNRTVQSLRTSIFMSYKAHTRNRTNYIKCISTRNPFVRKFHSGLALRAINRCNRYR